MSITDLENKYITIYSFSIFFFSLDEGKKTCDDRNDQVIITNMNQKRRIKKRFNVENTFKIVEKLVDKMNFC